MSLNRSNLKAEEDGSRVDKEQMQGQVQCSIVRPNLSRHTKHAIVPGPGGSWARYLLVLGGEPGVRLCKFKHPAMVVPAGVKTQPELCLPSPVPHRLPKERILFSN